MSSQFYDSPLRETYTFAAINFASASTLAIKGPTGKQARLESVMVSVTTSFVGTTTPGQVLVGLSGDTDAYDTLNVGAAGAGTAAGAAVRSDPRTSIPADTAVLVTTVAPTGGSPAGVATINVTIGWF